MRLLCLLFPLLGFVASTHAYVLNLGTNGVTRRWELINTPGSVPQNSVNRTTQAVRYYLASDAFSTTNTAAELNALRACIGQWESISNTHIKFEEAGLIDPPVDVNTHDGNNVFYWQKTTNYVNAGRDNIVGVAGLTVSSFSVPSYVMLECDIVFNGLTNTFGWTNLWFTDPNNTSTNVYVDGVALHEIGHFLGLDHSPAGCATMLFRGNQGVNPQAGLSDDEIAAARVLYPNGLENYGAVSGTVTKNGSIVVGAAVFAENSIGNVVNGTVTWTNGVYLMQGLVPGNYLIRVAPLDAAVGTRMVAGVDIGSTYSGADSSFRPTTNIAVTVTANATNTVNFAVSNGAPAFRITYTRKPTTNPNAYSWNSIPISMMAGQSNYVFGVAAANLPTSGVTLEVSGDGLTLGTISSNLNAFGTGLNFWNRQISISSNATPGMRNIILTQGTNIIYLNAFFEVAAPVTDFNFDGLDDMFQRQYFPVFTSASAAAGADPDGDGAKNSLEAASGTNPTNAISVFRMNNVSRVGNNNTVSWQSVNGKRYQVSALTNGAITPWVNIGTVVTAGSTNSQVVDNTTNAARIYRVQVNP